MKKSLIAALAVSTLFFMACGDDGSPSSPKKESNPGPGPNNISNNMTVTTTGSLSVDKGSQTLVITPDNPYKDYCMVEEDGSLRWKNVKAMDRDSAKYEFHGDTLIIFDYWNGRLENHGAPFLGGSAGNIYGTWKYIACRYSSTEKQISECYEKERDYIDSTVTFSEGKITTTTTYNFDKALEDWNKQGKMTTYFMPDLYEALSGGDVELYESTITNSDPYSNYIERSLSTYGITITESTDTSQTFTTGGKVYTATMERSDIIFNNDARVNLEANVSMDVVFTVTDGNRVCTLHYQQKTVTQDLCKTEYKDKLDSKSLRERDYNVVSMYEDSDIDGFEECIKSIAVVK